MQITQQLMVARKTLIDLNEELKEYRSYFLGDKFCVDTTVQVHEILSRITILKEQVEGALDSVTMPFKIKVEAGNLNIGDKAFLTEAGETLTFTCTYIGAEIVLFEYVSHAKGKEFTQTCTRNTKDVVWKAID